MQNAKDTFYEVLRNRLAVINPERTIVLRGVTRPGLEAVENELVNAFDLPDCFRVGWVGATVDSGGIMPLVAMDCELQYETAGTALNAGMDRGRLLAAMDGELLTAISQCPHSSVKKDFTGLPQGATPSAMQTNVWWSELTLGKQTVREDRLGRSAKVTLMSYQEAGEL